MNNPAVSLPHHLHIAIARRMTPRTFCRFRQTSRKIDSLIEANRFRISARTKVAQLSFLMSVDYLNPNVHRFQVFSGHVLQILDLHVKLDQRREEGLLNIEDPYKQLSGIGFDFILIQFVRNNNPFTTRDDLSAVPTMEQTFADNIFPVVERMKLECEWLAFNECTLVTWFIPLIRFSKFFVGHFPIPYAIFLTLDLSHCSDVVVAVIRDQPECETICQMVGNARRANFMFDQNVDVLDVLRDFLREIRRDRKNVRNLENLHLQALQSSFDDFNPPELNQIWKGEIHSGVRLPNTSDTTFWTYRIDNGMAIICIDKFKIDVYIVDEANRETLLACLHTKMFKLIPYDCSAIYEWFLEAESDTQALELLHNSFPNEDMN